MNCINSLEIPEIAHIIAGYLSNVEPCLTVCKTWRSLYLPYYWREVEAGVRVLRKKDHTPFFDPIRHGHYRKFVRTLTVYDDFSSINQLLDYPNLRLLHLDYHQEKARNILDDEDSTFENFVNRYPMLECLHLRNIPPSILDSACKALMNHPRLQEMVLRCNSSLLDDFWRVCTRIRSLQFSGPTRWSIPQDLMLPSIRRLTLMRLDKLGFMDQLDIIAACPLLEDLFWFGGGSYSHPLRARFGQLASQGVWPHLQRLSTDFGEDVSLSQVIVSMHQATKLEIYNDSFGPLSFAALQCHASTLEHLRLPKVTDSRMIRDVVCTFTRLEHLQAPCIDAKDIAEGGLWACTSLRSLLVNISFDSDDDNLQPVVFERISRLVHLEEFNSWFRLRIGATRTHGLIFTLQSGMAALASLSRLQLIGMNSDIQAMDIEDVQWIMDHWKRLETIQGRLSQDRSMVKQLGVLLSTSRTKIHIWES